MSLDTVSRQSVGTSASLNILLDEFPAEGFEVAGGLAIESLTSGHGQIGAGVSAPRFCGVCQCPCPCTGGQSE